MQRWSFVAMTSSHPAEVEALHPDRILISPGPCTPQEAGISIAASAALCRPPAIRRPQDSHPRSLPRPPGHRRSLRRHRHPSPKAHARQDQPESLTTASTIFAGIPATTTCTRYHSLIVQEEDLPDTLEISARTRLARNQTRRSQKPSWPSATEPSPLKASSSILNPF